MQEADHRQTRHKSDTGSMPASETAHDAAAARDNDHELAAHNDGRHDQVEDKEEMEQDTTQQKQGAKDTTASAPSKAKPAVKPKPRLPRLTADSRAPSSNLGTEIDERPEKKENQGSTESQQEPNKTKQDAPSTSAPKTEEGPVHLQASHEIPLHVKRQPSSDAHNHSRHHNGGGTGFVEDSSASDSEGYSADDSETDNGQDATDQECDDEQADSDREGENATPRASATGGLRPKTDDDERNPTIQIPKVTSVASGLTLPPNLRELAEGLEDKYIDEFGNILDWDGRVLGRVAGDLPAMIGRPVSVTGEVITEDGTVVGYVAENDTLPPKPPPPQPLHGLGANLRVDHMGNLLDADDNVVGHLKNHQLGGGGGGEKKDGQKQEHGSTGHPTDGATASGSGDNGGGGRGSNNNNCNCHRQNPKPTATPSPSEIYLDVKSTNDGVQLIIKIPTVFNGGGGQNIHINTS